MRINLLSVVIPAYNEGENIINTLEKIKPVLNSVQGLKYEIIVVNDGSNDNTAEILNGCSGIRSINRAVNRGYGYSIKEGIEHSVGEWILIADADGTYPLGDIPRLIAETEHYDMVTGERSKGNVSLSFINKAAKSILKTLIYFLAYRWIVDINSGFRVFRKEMFTNSPEIFPDGFSFTTTLTLLSVVERYQVMFVPIEYHKRIGKSHIKPVRDFISFVVLIVRIMTLFRPMRFFMPIAVIFFLAAFGRAIRDIHQANGIGTLAVLLFIISIQSFFFGILGDLVILKINGLIHRLKRSQ